MSARMLQPYEIDAARMVFKSSLAYVRVRIIENVLWPNWLGRIGSWLTKSPAPDSNAVCLGSRIYFPRRLETDPEKSTFSPVDMSWLMHELTHCWQYQQDGIIYLFQALKVQLQQGSCAYHYGGADGLNQARQHGMKLKDFNREQQADIVRHYYHRLQEGIPTEAWLPFIEDIAPSTPPTRI
ncbi:MAG: hypothetical protein JXA97_04045 [Anaerolineales bacterium]|nr:hypothetical protein [Anaerolineales bacterium]